MKSEEKQAVRGAYLIPLALILGLAACDGEKKDADKDVAKDAGKSQASSTMAATPTTGILTDAAVGGVAYLASSGAAGTTDEKGVYKYNHGDTVEFKLGSLIIGKVTGAPIVTPMELAGDNSARLQNLLVLLQSLDADGNPENGISIPASAAAAISASINLDSDPAAFAASAELQKVREAGGITGPVRTIAQAKAHFLSQGMAMLSTNIWFKQDGSTAFALRALATGEYLQGDAIPDDFCDANRICGGTKASTAGVEYGTASLSEFDNRGFKIIGKPTVDTNLKAGLSHPQPTWRVRTDGVDLIATEIVTVQRERAQHSVFSELFHAGKRAGPLAVTDKKEPPKTRIEESRYSRMENDPKGIVGAWVLNPAAIKTPTYLFFANGKFLLVDPIGDPDRDGHKSCGAPGVEFTAYTYDASSKAFSIKGFTYDTNGCAGFSENNALSFSISADGNTATVNTQNKSTLTLYRVSK